MWCTLWGRWIKRDNIETKTFIENIVNKVETDTIGSDIQSGNEGQDHPKVDTASVQRGIHVVGESGRPSQQPNIGHELLSSCPAWHDHH